VCRELGELVRLAAGAGSPPVLSGRSPERRREVEGEADGRDPPVSVCVREGQRAVRAGERSRAGLGRARGPSSWVGRSSVVYFFLLFKSA